MHNKNEFLYFVCGEKQLFNCSVETFLGVLGQSGVTDLSAYDSESFTTGVLELNLTIGPTTAHHVHLFST